MVVLFFFSSRRRHTRSLCDWSSDVCSSDLDAVQLPARREPQGGAVPDALGAGPRRAAEPRLHPRDLGLLEIGRAAGREREYLLDIEDVWFRNANCASVLAFVHATNRTIASD